MTSNNKTWQSAVDSSVMIRNTLAKNLKQKGVDAGRTKSILLGADSIVESLRVIADDKNVEPEIVVGYKQAIDSVKTWLESFKVNSGQERIETEYPLQLTIQSVESIIAAMESVAEYMSDGGNDGKE